jgi:ABC-2 type transport system ATP-binding protein
VEAGAAITVEGLLVERGGHAVLHEVSLSVASRSVTGLLGPSGCGKSTLMRSIVGVQIVAAGEVIVLGQAAGAEELRRRVGYVTQAPSIYSDLSIEENLRYFAARLTPFALLQRTSRSIERTDTRYFRIALRKQA